MTVLQPDSMSPAARTEPELELGNRAPCRNCGQPLPPGQSVCPACGAAHGEANRCPHCDAVADVEPHNALIFRCLVCGGPRVALDVAGVTPSDRTRSALVNAGSEQTKHVMFSAAGLFLSGMGALALLIATAVVLSASPGLVPTLATYLAASVPLVAGLLALSRAATARNLRSEALRTAQISALGDVQSVTGLLDAKRVTELMRLSPERAELLLAEASVAALLNDAPVPAPRLRIEMPAPTVAGTPTELEQKTTELGEPGATVSGDTEI
jgi:hypothetical protein